MDDTDELRDDLQTASERLDRLEAELRQALPALCALRDRVRAARAEKKLEAVAKGEAVPETPLPDLPEPARPKVLRERLLRTVRDACDGAHRSDLRSRRGLLDNLVSAFESRGYDRHEPLQTKKIGSAVRRHPGDVPEDLTQLLRQLKARAREHDRRATA